MKAQNNFKKRAYQLNQNSNFDIAPNLNNDSTLPQSQLKTEPQSVNSKEQTSPNVLLNSESGDNVQNVHFKTSPDLDQTD